MMLGRSYKSSLLTSSPSHVHWISEDETQCTNHFLNAVNNQSTALEERKREHLRSLGRGRGRTGGDGLWGPVGGMVRGRGLLKDDWSFDDDDDDDDEKKLILDEEILKD